ncbi:O-antigen ligase family protein [Leifsonia sp. NPDC058230]|uniref:O-antigen ligase family protein n=1 Tax=Leifsonia sp. NPDC058230 TaxID=3346391 RepID=UPI0036D9F807
MSRVALTSPTVQEGSRLDASWLLTGYVLVLLLIPANLTISALGAVGTPALLVGLAALIWWVGAQMNRSIASLSPPQSVRRAMLGFTLAVLISYVVATMRPIDGLELNSADRGLLLIASWLGIVLLASDGLTTTARIERPLRVLVIVGGIIATIGILQFFTGKAIVDVIQIPGLTPNTSLTSIYGRNGFNRAAGTSTHPIEFGVVLSMILPLALHFAFADTHRSKFVRWFPVAAIAFAVPITISRSALVGVVVALAILMPIWPKRRRRMSYAVIAAIIVAVYVTIPGMLGTLTRLFTGISEDGSAASRTDSYALAWEFIKRSPVFGRGLGTFLPQYRILDNQYLGLLIEVGILGTAAILTLFIVAILTGFATRKMSSDPVIRSLAQALAAMVAAGACSFATFDAFGFPQASSLVFFGVGFIGALSNVLKRQTLAAAGITNPALSARPKRSKRSKRRSAR